MRKILFISILLCSIFSVAAQRNLQTINNAWKFSKENPNNAESNTLDDKYWETVNIPHCWNADAYVSKFYYRGTAWYRKHFIASKDLMQKQVFIKFEGINVTAEVYLNGRFVTKHEGGYTAFTIDATPFLAFGEENLLAVKVDNSLQDLPPLSGDFTMFGGIYRDVWMITVPKQHIELLNAGSSGIFIQTPKVSAESAEVLIKGDIKNDAGTSSQVKVVNQIINPEGKIIQTLEKSLNLKSGEKTSFELASKEITRPVLWSPESPQLYQVKTTMIDTKNNQILDEISNPLGFRWFKFTGSDGFYFNGKPMKLIGICRHQDQKPLGNALSDEMHRRDMQLAKEMGANFIRISHYPQDDAILEQCDKLGLIAWEEIPIVNTVNLSDHFQQVCKTNVLEMVRQHYNHPSIIMWGYMNESALVTVRSIPEKDRQAVYDKTKEIAENLEKIIKIEDPGRASTIAFHNSQIYNQTGLSSITDVIGWNLYQGWYEANLEGFDKFIRKENEKHPNHSLIISEYGAGSDKRLHSLQPVPFDFSIEHQQTYHEHYLPVIAREKYISGSTVWNFVDFGSASRDESMPMINNKGLLYTDRTPKDVYFYYKAFLRKDVPVLHIASRDWDVRSGVQNGNNPVISPLKIYSNCPEVELFADGKSLGKKKIQNFTAVWNVPFAQGKTFFHAKGKYVGKQTEDGMNISFEAIPAKLNATNIKSLELAVNVGSNCAFTSEESNKTWLPDQAYTSGGWGYTGGDIFYASKGRIGSQIKIGGTTDNPLYQTLRKDITSYRFDVPEGIYELELLFADVFSKTGKVVYNLTEEDQSFEKENIFDIVINKNVEVKDLNISREFGHFFAVKKRFIVEVKGNENLSIEFPVKKGSAFLNGIKLRKL